MALDSKQKRGSAIGLSLPNRQWLVEPSGTLGTAGRKSLLKLEAGSDAVAPVFTSPADNPHAIQFDEGSDPDPFFSGTYTGTDPVTPTLSGANAALFTVNAAEGGEFSVIANDALAAGAYTFDFKLENGNGNGSVTVNVTVNAVDDDDTVTCSIYGTFNPDIQVKQGIWHQLHGGH